MLNHNTTNIDKNFRQVIILDNNVEMVKSDDVLFSTERLQNLSVAKWFPFVESIHESLKSLKLGDDELLFSRIESPAEFLSGSYDFSFLKIELDGKEYIQWCIYDYTLVYTYLSKYQQLKNEKDIYRQKLEYRIHKIESLDDLF